MNLKEHGRHKLCSSLDRLQVTAARCLKVVWGFHIRFPFWLLRFCVFKSPHKYNLNLDQYREGGGGDKTITFKKDNPSRLNLTFRINSCFYYWLLFQYWVKKYSLWFYNHEQWTWIWILWTWQWKLWTWLWQLWTWQWILWTWLWYYE